MPETPNHIETYLFKADDVPWNEGDRIHFGHNPTVAQDCTCPCKRSLELFDDTPSLVVLNKANNCVEQEQASNDPQIDPVLQSGSQYKRQL